jgi:D-methionine transport system substrate-binding protein
MKKNFTKLCSILLTISLSISLVACGNSAKKTNSQADSKKTLKLGCLAYSEPMIQWIKTGLEPLGYKVEVVMFDANQLPATALKDGNLDGIIANHKPWIETFNKQNNCDLKMVEPYLCYGFFAIYSSKYKTLDSLPQNAKIVVSNDPTNMSRSLLVLKDAGLLTLNEKTGAFYSILDIKDNPKKIKFVETEITQTARSIADVDAVVSTAFYVSESKTVDPNTYLFEDKQNINFPLGLIVSGKEANAQWAKEAMKVLKSAEGEKKFNDQYKGKYKFYK